MNALKHASNPLAETKVSLGAAARFAFEPTKSEVADWRKRQAASAEAIRAGLARMKAKGL